MFEFLILLGSILLGFAGAPWWIVLIAAALLTISVVSGDACLAHRYPRVGVVRVFAIAFTLSVANNLAFAGLSYGLGRGAAWIVSA
jgi:hypothetical protein